MRLQAAQPGSTVTSRTKAYQAILDADHDQTSTGLILGNGGRDNTRSTKGRLEERKGIDRLMQPQANLILQC